MKLTQDPTEYARIAASQRQWARECAEQAEAGGAFEGMTAEMLAGLLEFLSTNLPKLGAGRPPKGYRERRVTALSAGATAVLAGEPVPAEAVDIVASELRLWASRLSDTSPNTNGRPKLFEKGECAYLYMRYREVGMQRARVIEKLCEAFDCDPKRIEDAIRDDGQGMREARAFAASWPVKRRDK